LERGRTIRSRMPKSPAPSTRALSMSSRGMFMKKLRSTRKLKALIRPGRISAA
jgi:hypothetical protein